MPNWVINRIKFKNKDAFEAFKREYVVKKTCEGVVCDEFDFNKVIPMPESLDIEENTTKDDGIILAVAQMLEDRVPGAAETAATVGKRMIAEHPWASVAPGRLPEKGLLNVEFFLTPDLKLKQAVVEHIRGRYKDPAELRRAIELGKKAIQNILDHGYSSWYHWAYANWDTKWGASEYREDPDSLEVWFETAWSCPVPIIQRIVALTGIQAFEEIEWADESIGYNCGRFELMLHLDGTGFDQDWVEPAWLEEGSEEAKLFAKRLWGYEDPDA